MTEIHCLFFISFVAAAAPLLIRLRQLARMPEVVLELILGIVIGPSLLGLVSSHGAIGFLGEFGLIFLFFQAGLEFNPEEIGAGPLRLGATAWLAAFALSVLFAGFLALIGLLRAPVLIALVLPTTAFGMVLPILRESGNLPTDLAATSLAFRRQGNLARWCLLLSLLPVSITICMRRC